MTSSLCNVTLNYAIQFTQMREKTSTKPLELKALYLVFVVRHLSAFFLLCMHMWQSVKKNYNLRSEFLVFFVLFLLISERAWKLTLKKKTTAMTYSKDFSIEKPHHTMRWIVVRAFVSTLCADRNKAGVLKLCDRFIV